MAVQQVQRWTRARIIVLRLGVQGWRSGESTRLPPMWPRFESWRRRHMWVEFVLGSLPCSERFFSRYSSFPLSLNTNTYQIPIRSERTGHVSTSSYELLSAPWVNKLQFYNQITIDNWQLTIDNWQLTIYNLQFTIDNWQFTIDNLQLTIYNLQFTIYNLQFTIYNLQFTIYNT